ncbi:MAG: hypothetical protein RLZZ241_1575 [Bacteroidota bacterium]|jgi:hypothetical protein
MNKLFLLFIFLGIWSCAVEQGITWGSGEYKGGTCSGCPEVLISIPEALDTLGMGKVVNTSLREEIISLLDYDDSNNAETISQAIASFENASGELQKKFPDEQMEWEAKIVGEISYEDNNIISISLDTYTFTGGAHGLAFSRFLNFSKISEAEIELLDFFDGAEKLIEMSEKIFRAQFNIPDSIGINETGFMFEGDVFSLPQTMGFSPNGLELIYNTYEIASYADGEIRLTLSWESIAPYLLPEYRTPQAL